MITPDRIRTGLDRLEDALDEITLAMPKEELLTEAAADGVDVAAFAARTRAHVDQVVRETNGRRLSIFCDYCATGVWLDGVCVDPIEHVGLSQDTADRLRAWQLVYDLQDPFDEEGIWEERWGGWHDREGERIHALVWAEVGDRFRRD